MKTSTTPTNQAATPKAPQAEANPFLDAMEAAAKSTNGPRLAKQDLFRSTGRNDNKYNDWRNW